MNPMEWDMAEGLLCARVSGYGAIALLVVSQMVSPLQLIFRIRGCALGNLRKIRKWAGIAAAILAICHVGLMSLSYLQGDFTVVLEHAWLRAGAAAFILLLALLVSSFNPTIRILGRLWKMLHRCSYFLIFLIVLHLWGAPRSAAISYIGLLYFGVLVLLPRVSQRFFKNLPS